MSDDFVEVTCVQCGRVDSYPGGYLTEKAQREYRCSACREPVVERQVQERQVGDRKLLTED